MPTPNSNSKSSQVKAIQKWLVNQLAQQLSLDAKTIDVTEPLTRYGLDSIDAVTMVGDLEDWLDLELPSTLFWDSPTIAKSAEYLAENFEISIAGGDSDDNPSEVEKPSPEPEPVAAGKGWGNLWGKISGK